MLVYMIHCRRGRDSFCGGPTAGKCSATGRDDQIRFSHQGVLSVFQQTEKMLLLVDQQQLNECWRILSHEKDGDIGGWFYDYSV